MFHCCVKRTCTSAYLGHGELLEISQLALHHLHLRPRSLGYEREPTPARATTTRGKKGGVCGGVSVSHHAFSSFYFWEPPPLQRGTKGLRLRPEWCRRKKVRARESCPLPPPCRHTTCVRDTHEPRAPDDAATQTRRQGSTPRPSH